jgi:hypothetical protein
MEHLGVSIISAKAGFNDVGLSLPLGIVLQGFGFQRTYHVFQEPQQRLRIWPAESAPAPMPRMTEW